MRPINELTELVIGTAIEVHRHLGPGLLESAYESCLCEEMNLRQIGFVKQVQMPVTYKGKQIECAYRLDLLVEGQLIVELKSVSEIQEMHRAQLLSYLRLSGCKVGLLINFNVTKLVNGIQRLSF
jgi:GxxExxY protein